MCTVGLHRCERVVRVSLSESKGTVYDFRNCSSELLIDFVTQSSCDTLASTGRKFELDSDTTIISLREELCLHHRSDSTYRSTKNNK